MKKIKSQFFKNSKLIPKLPKSKFQDLVLNEKDREKILNIILEKRKIKESLRTEEDVSERLAAEVQELQSKRLVEQKLRQQLRENNPELKELERKLRSAYASKALAAQLVEREALRKAEKTQLRKENALMEKALREYSEIQRMQEEEEHKKKMQCKEGLLEQMASAQQEKAKRYEDFLKEKELIDEIIRKIHEEHLEEMREKLSKKIEIQKEMDEFMRFQEEWKKKQRREAEEENRQIAKIVKQKIDDAEQIKRETEREMKKKEEISAAIGQRIFSEEEEKLKKIEVLLDLQAEEMNAMEDRKLREDMEKKLRERITARVKLQEHREDIIRRKQEEKEEERKYREEQMRIMAEKDKLDQLSDEKKRRKVLEHRRALQKSFEERKRQRAQDFSIMVKEREQELQEEKRRQELIEEERIRMLKEHATALLGYLPLGILKEGDREHLPLPPKK